MRLLIVSMFFWGFSLAEARGIRSIVDRLPQVIKRADIGRFVAMGALGTMIFCSPGCEYGDRMVDGGFTRSGNPALGRDSITYLGTDLSYSLGNVVGGFGAVQETNHTGIDVQIGFGTTRQALVLTLNRHDIEKGKTFENSFTIYLGTVNRRSFDIYNSYGGSDIGDGYVWENGQRRYVFDAGNGVELTLIISGETTTDGVTGIVLKQLYAQKEVLVGQNFHGQLLYRNERFSWLGLPSSHFLRIGTDAQLPRQ